MLFICQASFPSPSSLSFLVYPPNFFLQEHDFGILLLEKSSLRQLVSFSLAFLLPMTSWFGRQIGVPENEIEGWRVFPTLLVFGRIEGMLLNLFNLLLSSCFLQCKKSPGHQTSASVISSQVCWVILYLSYCGHFSIFQTKHR